MRRREILGGSSIEYVFSAQTTSLYPDYNAGSTNILITSTANGSNIGYSVVSYDGDVVTSVTTAATSVTINSSSNSTYYNRSGYVVLKQNDSNKTITINLTQSAKPLELGYDAILLDGYYYSEGSFYLGIDDASFLDVPDWLFAPTYSDGYIYVGAKSPNSDSIARFDTITIIVGNTGTKLTIIQLPNDYHSRDYVTIGGLNWAIKNVGASSVEDYGNYYMYGKGSQVYNSSDSIYEGTENPLDSSVDTATQVMGSGWRMPTYRECDRLTDNSTYYWVSYNGVNGGVFEDGGNVLFFPANGNYYEGNNYNRGYDGYYWSSTPRNSNYAYSLDFGNWYFNVSGNNRIYGYSVRGVHE